MFLKPNPQLIVFRAKYRYSDSSRSDYFKVNLYGASVGLEVGLGLSEMYTKELTRNL